MRWILLAVATVLVFVAAQNVAPGLSTPSASAAAGTRVRWQSGSWYLQGTNLPWYNWGCDFGCGTSRGASDPAVRSVVGNALSQVRASGAHVVRWWVFPGDAWQITRDSTGAPASLNPAVYQDFDSALSLAAQYDIYFDFVLFSGPTHIPTSWQTNSAQRAKLGTALAPLFARYRDNPRILSWEIVNEPEFEIWNGNIAQSAVQATVRLLADTVHANSNAMVTVGSANLDGLPMWVGMGLDYYQAHWYDYMSSGGYCARCTDYATVQQRFNLDQPLVIGEMYAGPDTDALQRFVDFYNKGYAGTWAWSQLTDRTSDGMRVDMNAMRTFTSQRSDIGPRAGGVNPTPTPTRTPTRTPTAAPTRTPTPQPQPTGTATAQPPATHSATFDDLSNPNRPLNGQYPSGLINWGSGKWYLSAPWGAFDTNSISFSGSSPRSATFSFVAPRRLVRLDAFNGGSASTSISVACSGQPNVSMTVPAGQRHTLQTNWTKTCSTVTVSSGNGWDSNFDNLVFE